MAAHRVSLRVARRARRGAGVCRYAGGEHQIVRAWQREVRLGGRSPAAGAERTRVQLDAKGLGRRADVDRDVVDVFVGAGNVHLGAPDLRDARAVSARQRLHEPVRASRPTLTRSWCSGIVKPAAPPTPATIAVHSIALRRAIAGTFGHGCQVSIEPFPLGIDKLIQYTSDYPGSHDG